MRIIDFFKERNMWVTGIIALLFGPTVGLFYLNCALHGLLYLLVYGVFAVLLVSAAHWDWISFDIMFGLDFMYLALHVVGLVHCIVIARVYDRSQPVKWYAKWYSILVLLLVVPIGGSFLIRSVLFEPFHVPAGSMEPTIHAGDYVITQKYAYQLSEPKRGDIVVFHHPKNPAVNYMKRIVGLPGETIQLKQGQVYIDGAIVTQKSTDSYTTSQYGREISLLQDIEHLPNGRYYPVLNAANYGAYDDTEPYDVPKGHYFVLGDNRDNSVDSRFVNEMGVIPEANIIARAFVVFWNDETQTLHYRKVQAP